MTQLPDEHVVEGFYWSRRGEIACAEHAAERCSPRWEQEETVMASATLAGW
jgi:hypothetical protein